MINTDTAATIALTSGAVSSSANQTANVATAITNTTGTNTALIRSAIRWIGARDP